MNQEPSNLKILRHPKILKTLQDLNQCSICCYEDGRYHYHLRALTTLYIHGLVNRKDIVDDDTGHVMAYSINDFGILNLWQYINDEIKYSSIYSGFTSVLSMIPYGVACSLYETHSSISVILLLSIIVLNVNLIQSLILRIRKLIRIQNKRKLYRPVISSLFAIAVIIFSFMTVITSL